MADLYYADFSSMDVEELINKYEDKVDSERLSKITRTQPPEARVRSLLGGYLLQVAVKEYLGMPKEAEVLDLKYKYGKQGKPYLADYPGLSFSLSHSGKVVALAISGQEVGLDVQQHVAVKDGLAKRFFSGEENELLAKQTDENAYRALFFRLWSIKESYIKLTGLGMKQGLNSFRIDFDKREILENKVILSQRGNVGETIAFSKTNEQEIKKAVFDEIALKGLDDYSVSICLKEKEGVRVCTQKLI